MEDVESSSAGALGDWFRINYGEGLTPTEQVLKSLGQWDFLRFWSHANPRTSPTKELCDLLVVCGDYVIAFSDKSVDFRFDTDGQTAWRRWYDRAIAKSVRQLNGAVRRLVDHRAPVYKDNACIVPLGVPVLPPDRAKVYRVAVVDRSREAIDETRPQPFLRISGAVVGEQHVADGATPFAVGDVSPGTGFVHVVDLAGLGAVLTELDTVTDFARYLDAREAFIRGQPHNAADDERCLLTRYLLSYTEVGDPLPLDSANPGFTRLGHAERRDDSTKAALDARREANRDSYRWDTLVERQARMVERQGFDVSTYRTVEEAERVVRRLALEPRLHRRMLGRAWKEACLIALPGQAANIRTVPHGDGDATTYVFFSLKQPEGMPDEEYRRRRREMLQDIVLASLVDVPTSEVIVGIASELGQEPDSYDLLHFNIAEDANLDTLQADAKRCWEFKKRFFEDPRLASLDERDVPPRGLGVG